MSPGGFAARVRGRIARAASARRHTREDRVLAARALSEMLDREAELARLGASIVEDPRHPWILPVSPAARLAEWSEAHPEWGGRACAEAAPLLGGSLLLFGHRYDLLDPAAWTRDPATGRRWPLKPHGSVRLDDPRRDGDVRMQWEAARFQHALLLGRSSLASGDPAPGRLFHEELLSFARGNPFFRSLHWATAMEVALRASACLLAIEFFRPSRTIPGGDARALQILFAHGLYIETHLERHPLGFTTNHTLSDYAGLAVLGRAFASIETGRRWSRLAALGIEECLREQVLEGGAHAEASFPYERYALEAGLIGSLCLGAPANAPLREPLLRMAGHLRDATLPSGLPFVGDGDDSFFPPFACGPFDRCDPLDPESVLQAAAFLLDEPGLRRQEETREAAFWLGAPPRFSVEDHPARDERRAPRPVRGTGFVRVEEGPFEGILLVRGGDEGWLPTHGHNDQLSIVLDVDGESVLIDPGTGAYAFDRKLRRELRGTAAHSTLQLSESEQSTLRAGALFEGPRAVPAEVLRQSSRGLDLAARHEGFGPGWIHLRRLRGRGGRLWIADTLAGPEGSRSARSTVRLRFAPRLAPELARSGRAPLCRVALPTGRLELLLLRPRAAHWQIRSVPASRRYAAQEPSPLLEGTFEGSLPHRWTVALSFEAAR